MGKVKDAAYFSVKEGRPGFALEIFAPNIRYSGHCTCRHPMSLHTFDCGQVTCPPCGEGSNVYIVRVGRLVWGRHFGR